MLMGTGGGTQQNSSRSSLNTVNSSNRDAQNSITNPNIMWSSNGIGFDISGSSGNSAKSSAQTTFSKERIRKKLDVMLYNIDRKIKHLISQQLQTHHSLERFDIRFAKNLRSELATLNAYLESQKSRIMLQQVIEVILESLLMVKKCMIDLALKTSIFVMDFNKQNNFYSTTTGMTPEHHILNAVMRSSSLQLNTGSAATNGMHSHQPRSPHGYQNSMTANLNAISKSYQMVKCQRAYRKVFAEYLSLISTILSMAPSGTTQVSQLNFETMKLLNEVFVAGDDQWQESVKTFVISLYLSDIASTLTLKSNLPQIDKVDPSHIQLIHQQQSILVEELRGISLVNFDEQFYMQTVLSTIQVPGGLNQIDQIDVLYQSKKCIYHILLCAKSAMEYFESTLQFFKKAISQHFSHRYGNQKNKQGANSGGAAGASNNMMGDDIQNQRDPLGKLDGKLGGNLGQGDLRRATVGDQQSSACLIASNEEQFLQLQKYWKQTIRRVLYQCMYLITPPNGLLTEYLQNNAINFVNCGPGQGGQATQRFNVTGRGVGGHQSVSPTRPSPQFYFGTGIQNQGLSSDEQSALRYGLSPLNFNLTVQILSFLRLFFELPEKFTKYVFLQEELMLFYIRTHYISYVRLYNKNFSKKMENNLDNESSKRVALESKQRSMTLCKEHLECLFAISKNRTEDTRRKLYQFKILQFLCQEIELEFECTTAANKQKRTRLLKEAQKSNTIPLIMPSSQQVAEIKEEDVNQVQQPLPQPKKTLPLGLKMLNLSGLEPPQMFGGAEPKEKIEQPILVIETQQKLEEVQTKPKVDGPPIQQPAKKPFAFGIPKLNIGGLGLSEIIPESQNQNQGAGGGPAKTQLEIDQLRQLAEEQKKKQEQKSSRRVIATQSSRKLEESKLDISTSSYAGKPKIQIPKLQGVEKLGLTGLVKDEFNQQQEASVLSSEQQISTVPKKLPFSIPKLKVAGLGLSELVPDDKKEDEKSYEKQNQIHAEDEASAPPAGPPIISKHPGLMIPKLNVTGLTLSELVPDNQPPQQLEVPMQSKSITKIVPKLNITGLGLSELVQKSAEHSSAPIPPKKELPVSIPKLNVAGLGFSDLVKDDKKPDVQQELQQEILYQEPPKKSVPKIGIPKLNITGLGLSDLVKDETTPQLIINPPEAQVDPPKKPKLGIPKLNITGLGLSEIVPDSIPNPDQNKKGLENDLTTLNPNDKTIEYGGYLDAQVDQNHDDMIKQVKGLMPFENTAPVKTMMQNDETAVAFIGKPPHGVSAPQENRKLAFEGDPQQNLATVLAATRNQMTDLSVKESVESAQFINYIVNNKNSTGQLPLEERKHLDKKIHQLRISQQSNATQLRVESILDAGSAKNGCSVIPSPMPELHQTMPKHFPSKTNFINFGSQYSQSPNPHDIAGGRERSFRSGGGEGETYEKQPKHVVYSQPKPAESQLSAKGQENSLAHNNHGTDRPQLIIVEENLKPDDQGRSQPLLLESKNNNQLTPILKKPNVPSLKIPKKVDQLEGKEKILQQIAYSEQLNNVAESGEGAGNLTKLQNELIKNNVKFQVLLEHQKSQKQLITDNTAEDLELNPIFAQGSQVLQNGNIYEEEEAFYLKERSMRPIYQDEELHVLMLSLIVCLLLKPERGTLDELYCSQYPLDNGKQNILFLMHHHLNHPKNNQQQLIHKVLDRVHRDVNPPLAGLRLLKLLCTSLFDINLYNKGKEWKKLAEGAYAKVFESKTNLTEPSQVAVKQLFLPKTIYDRCVLHDIFTEITCLEELRLEPCVSDLYDYGVDGSSYYIVMKRYNCSLRQWRLQQTKGLNENLSLYLSIYKEFLKSLQIIHSHNVTHYDIKCDNLFLDFNTNGSNSLSQQFSTGSAVDNEDEGKIKLTVGDFGECKIFSSEKDELCQRNRGTDFCKSPEMLQLTINTRKDTDKYDRRKQVGTNRLSDVWSTGCLLFELLTGDYLFYNPDYLQFHFRVTRTSEALFTPDKLDKINNNVYLIDFMKYMLVRDSRLRPSIENVLKRFEHVHALLVSTTGGGGGLGSGLTNYRMNMISNNPDGRYTGSLSGGNVGGGTTFENMLLEIAQIMIKDEEIQQTQSAASLSQTPFLLKIMDDVSICNFLWFKKHFGGNNRDSLFNMNFTHLIYTSRMIQSSDSFMLQIRDSFNVLELKSELQFPDDIKLRSTAFLLLPQVLDFMRSIALCRGRVLFIEDTLASGIEGSNLIRECLLLALSHVYQTNAYETYTLIRSQNLLFSLPSPTNGQILNGGGMTSRLALISQFAQLSTRINSYLSTYPRFQCRCGQCIIILKRQFANYSNMETVTCNCCQYYRTMETSQCPSPGCNEFIQFMKTYFKVIQMDNLHWGFLEVDEANIAAGNDRDPFILGPKFLGNLHHSKQQFSKGKSGSASVEVKVPNIQNIIERMIASNMSCTIDKNSTLVSIIEKKNTLHIAGGAHGQQVRGMKPSGGDSLYGTNNSSVNGPTIKWKLYKCKDCQVWTHAMNEAENRIAVLLNNRVKDPSKNHYVNIRSLNLKQQMESANAANVRVPILQKIKLSLHF